MSYLLDGIVVSSDQMPDNPVDADIVIVDRR